MIQNTFRFPSELYEWLKRSAREDNRSIQAQVLTLLREALEARER